MHERVSSLKKKLKILLPNLDERQRRILVAAEAEEYGYGGVSLLSELTGINRMGTIYVAVMAVARKEEFARREIALSDFAKVLSHPARIAILTVLAEKRECICGDLVSDLPLAQSTVSQHLKALKELGLIKGEVDGPRSRYCIDWKMFARLQREFGSWLDEMAQYRADNCC